MTEIRTGTHPPASAGLGRLYASIDGLLAKAPASVALLALRVALAVPFFKSGLTKWDGLQVSAGARYLFAEEFKLHILGQAYSYPAPVLMAHLAAIGEIVMPILLVLGLLTRFAALGILAMTIVIQLTIPEGWANFHLPWAAMSLALIVYGGGRIGVDRYVMGGRQ